jgi:pilus assembly protein TadC
MTTGLLVAAALSATAAVLALMPRPRAAVVRLRRLAPRADDALVRPAVRPKRVRSRLIAALGGIALAAGIGGWLGFVLGPVLAGAAYVWLARRPNREHADEDRCVTADLPFAADLLGAALRAGATPDSAARSVGSAVGGPIGDRLARVDRALRLGASAEEAWSYLGEVEGGKRVIQAAVRSQHSGAAFAGSLYRVADDLRADRLIAADAAARRAGVLIVLPLGLCFLPAFVLAGLVPVIVAVLGDVLSP